jgi:hypothetical protein
MRQHISLNALGFQPYREGERAIPLSWLKKIFSSLHPHTDCMKNAKESQLCLYSVFENDENQLLFTL